MSAGTTLMTAKEFLALPDDGVERWLIRGEVREFGMTVRNRWHSRTEAGVVFALLTWLRTRSAPRGAVCSGEAGFRLQRNPDLIVGIDVAVISPELAAANPSETTLIDGVPMLAVEILSPSDTVEEIDEKVQTYLDAGIPLIWEIHSRRRTVSVLRPGQPAVLFNDSHELDGGPQLPGFRVRVAELFDN